MSGSRGYERKYELRDFGRGERGGVLRRPDIIRKGTHTHTRAHKQSLTLSLAERRREGEGEMDAGEGGREREAFINSSLKKEKKTITSDQAHH